MVETWGKLKAYIYLCKKVHVSFIWSNLMEGRFPKTKYFGIILSILSDRAPLKLWVIVPPYIKRVWWTPTLVRLGGKFLRVPIHLVDRYKRWLQMDQAWIKSLFTCILLLPFKGGLSPCIGTMSLSKRDFRNIWRHTLRKWWVRFENAFNFFVITSVGQL